MGGVSFAVFQVTCLFQGTLLFNLPSPLCTHISHPPFHPQSSSGVLVENAKCKCELCKQTNFDAQVSLVGCEGTKGPADVPPCLMGCLFVVSVGG